VLNQFVEDVVAWLQDNCAPPAQDLEPASFRNWRDTVMDGPDNYIDYLLAQGVLKQSHKNSCLSWAAFSCINIGLQRVNFAFEPVLLFSQSPPPGFHPPVSIAGRFVVGLLSHQGAILGVLQKVRLFHFSLSLGKFR
jgi:hypothetical protein